MGRGTDRALAVSRGWIPPSDGGTRRRGKPRRSASRVRAVPAASRGRAGRVSVAGDRRDLPCIAGGAADVRSNDAGRRADGRTRYARALASPDGGSTAPGGAGSRAKVAEAPRSPSLCAHRRDRCHCGGSAHGVRSRWKRPRGRLGGRRLAGRLRRALGSPCRRTSASAQHPLPSRPAKVRIGSPTPTATRCRGSTLATTAVVQTIPVGNGPSGIAIGAGAVWVVNSLDGTVSRIDPGTNTVVQKITVGGGPLGIVYAAALGLGREQRRRNDHEDRPRQRHDQDASGRRDRARLRRRHAVGEPACRGQGGSHRSEDREAGRRDRGRERPDGDRLRLWRGVGGEQPGRDGLPDRSRHELRDRARDHRERATRGGRRRTRHLGERPVRRQRRADRSQHEPGGAAGERGRPSVGTGDVGRRRARRRPSAGRRPPRRDARAAG